MRIRSIVQFIHFQFKSAQLAQFTEKMTVGKKRGREEDKGAPIVSQSDDKVYKAAHEALIGLNITDDSDSSILRVATCLQNHKLRASQNQCASICTLLTVNLLTLEYIRALQVIKRPPLDILLDSAQKDPSIKFKRCVFLAEKFQRTHQNRHLATEGYVPSSTLTAIRGAFSNSNSCTVLLSGNSGSGKTSLLFGLADSNEEMKEKTCEARSDSTPSFAIIGSAADVSINKNELNIAVEDTIKSIRDENVVTIIAKIVESTLVPESLNALRGAELGPIILHIALDELGEMPSFVRGMASIVPDSIRTKLKFHSSVSIRLIAAGTGVGGSSQLWGSEDSDFKMFVAGDETVNAKLFDSFGLSQLDLPLDLSPCRDFALSNARLAMCMGMLLQSSFKWLAANGNTSAQVTAPIGKRFCVDLSAFKTIAALRFKSSNGLWNVAQSELFGLLCQALRMHLFPFVFRRKRVLFKYGMVVDKSQPIKSSDWPTELSKGMLPIPEQSLHGSDKESFLWCAPAEGHFTLPPFVTNLFALLCGLPWIVRSDINGDSLERYFFGASALAASAAGDPRLFTALLESGSLAPLVFHRAEGDGVTRGQVLDDSDTPSTGMGDVAVDPIFEVGLLVSSSDFVLHIMGWFERSQQRMQQVDAVTLMQRLSSILKIPPQAAAHLSACANAAFGIRSKTLTEVSAAAASVQILSSSDILELIKACKPYAPDHSLYTRLMGAVLAVVEESARLPLAKAMIQASLVRMNPIAFGCEIPDVSRESFASGHVGNFPASRLLVHDFQLHGNVILGEEAKADVKEEEQGEEERPEAKSEESEEDEAKAVAADHVIPGKESVSQAPSGADQSKGQTQEEMKTAAEEIAFAARLSGHVRAVLRDWKASADYSSKQGQPIAAFRGFAKASFADSFMFDGDTAFYMQYKETKICGWTQNTYTLERAKMSREAVVESLKTVWKEEMGVDITQVRYVFVTPNVHTFGLGTGLSHTTSRPDWVNKCDLFVTTFSTQFLSFNPIRQGGRFAAFYSALQ